MVEFVGEREGAISPACWSKFVAGGKNRARDRYPVKLVPRYLVYYVSSLIQCLHCTSSYCTGL